MVRTSATTPPSTARTAWRTALSRSPQIEDATAAFEGYDYARALQRTESFFWRFCDDYLELVKGRRYGEQGGEAAGSANAALTAALSVLLRLFAPFLPFVTEEVWSWWQDGSIHRAPWPRREELVALSGEVTGDEFLKWEYAREVLGAVRRRRSEAKQSMKVPILRAVIADAAERLARLDTIEADLRSAGRIATIERVTREPFEVNVEFGEATA